MGSERAIGRVGTQLGLPAWKQFDWLDPNSVHDFDLVILNPNGFTRGSARGALGSSGGFDVLDVGGPAYEAILRRSKELYALLELKGDVVIFAEEELRAWVTDFGESTSGWDYLPSRLDGLTVAGGKRVEVVDDGPIGRFIQTHINSVSYAVTLDHKNAQYQGWKPLAVTERTKLWVGAVWQDERGGGRIIVLPSMNTLFRTPNLGRNAGLVPSPFVVDAARQTAFWNSFVQAVSTHAVERAAVPDWVGAFASQRETVANTLVIAQEQVVLVEQSKLEGLKHDLLASQELNALLYSTDTELEIACGNAFERLGGVLLPVTAGRADLRVQFEDWIAVVEVKGLAGSAGERNAAQLEKWAIEELDIESGLDRKSVLLVNAFRDADPNERTQPAFPHQMLKYAEGREQVLITTSQLFVALDQIDLGKLTAAQFLSLLRSTNGVLSGFPLS